MVLGFLEGKDPALLPCILLLKAAKPAARLFLSLPPVVGLFLKAIGAYYWGIIWLYTYWGCCPMYPWCGANMGAGIYW